MERSSIIHDTFLKNEEIQSVCHVNFFLIQSVNFSLSNYPIKY